jgi:hypothetical protein
MKKTRTQLEKIQAQSTHVGARPPIPVIVKDVYRKENLVTVKLASDDPSIDGQEIAGVKFPIMAPIEMSVGMLVKPGVRGMLFTYGYQISKGYVMLSHTEGTLKSVTYEPIRHSWAV